MRHLFQIAGSFLTFTFHKVGHGHRRCDGPLMISSLHDLR